MARYHYYYHNGTFERLTQTEPAAHDGSVRLERVSHVRHHLRLNVGNPGNQDEYYFILCPVSCYCHSSAEVGMMVSEEVGRNPLLSPRNGAYWIYDITGIDTVDHIDHWFQMVHTVEVHDSSMSEHM